MKVQNKKRNSKNHKNYHDNDKNTQITIKIDNNQTATEK